MQCIRDRPGEGGKERGETSRQGASVKLINTAILFTQHRSNLYGQTALKCVYNLQLLFDDSMIIIFYDIIISGDTGI